MTEDSQRCGGTGMVAYWDGSAYAGEMCRGCIDCEPPDGDDWIDDGTETKKPAPGAVTGAATNGAQTAAEALSRQCAICYHPLDACSHCDSMADAAEMLWVVLANVSGGDWTQQSKEWGETAARWRDNYFAVLSRTRGAVSDEVFAVDPGAAERPPEAIRANELETEGKGTID